MMLLLAGAALIALLELDATSAGQLMLSRPAVVGPLLGLLFGEPVLGAALGAIWELLTLEPPIGGHMPINATAAVGSTILLCAVSRPLMTIPSLPPSVAFLLGAGLGWLHRAAEASLRRKRARCAAACESSLAAGGRPPFARLAAKELAKQFLLTFSLMAGVALARPALAMGWGGGFEPFNGGIQFALVLAPWLGLAALLRALRVRA